MQAAFTASRTAGLITWAIALGLAAWVISSLPLNAVLASMAALSFPEWSAWILLNLMILVIYVGRWMPLTRALGMPIRFMDLFVVRQAGQAVSFITPGPQFGGEPLQVYWLWKKYGNPGHRALLAVALDRFYELWMNFAVLLAGILILLASPAVSYADWTSVAAVMVLLIAGMSLLAWFMVSHQDKAAAGIRRLAGRWQQNPRMATLDAHWHKLGSQLRHLVANKKPALLTAFLLSVVGWAATFAELWLLLVILDIRLSFIGFVLLLVAMRLAFLLPLPGGVGTLEAAVLWVFTTLGVSAGSAAGLIALMRLRDAAVLCAGLAFLRLLQSRRALSANAGQVLPQAAESREHHDWK